MNYSIERAKQGSWLIFQDWYTIPNEILANIFGHSCVSLRPDDANSGSAVVALSRACRRFRDVTLRLPHPWTKPSTSNDPRRVNSFIGRSAPAGPIIIVTTVSDCQFESSEYFATSMEIIVKHSQRYNGLEIVYSPLQGGSKKTHRDPFIEETATHSSCLDCSVRRPNLLSYHRGPGGCA